MTASGHSFNPPRSDGGGKASVILLSIFLILLAGGAIVFFVLFYLPLLAEVSDLKSSQQKLLAENDSLRNKSKEIQDMMSAALSRVDELQSNQLGLVEEITKMKDVYDGLVGNLKPEIEAGNAEIVQKGGRVYVKLKDAILFPSGEAQLNKAGYAVLDRIGIILRTLRGKQVVIEGNTDDRPIGGALQGRFSTNWELSTARALSVLHYFVDRWGLDPSLLSATGFAEFRPVASNATEEGRAKNRRIEIAILPIDKGP